MKVWQIIISPKKDDEFKEELTQKDIDSLRIKLERIFKRWLKNEVNILFSTKEKKT